MVGNALQALDLSFLGSVPTCLRLHSTKRSDQKDPRSLASRMVVCTLTTVVMPKDRQEFVH